MRSFARGTKAVLIKVLVARVREAHFCSHHEKEQIYKLCIDTIQQMEYICIQQMEYNMQADRTKAHPVEERKKYVETWDFRINQLS